MNPRGLYCEGATPLHRLHPLTKIVAVCSALLVVLAVDVPPPSPGGSWGDAWIRVVLGPAALLTLLLAAAMTGGVARRWMTLLAQSVLPFLVSLLALQAMLAACCHGADPAAWMQTVRLGLRLLVCVAAVLLVLVTTHPGRLLQAALSRGLPAWLGYLAAAAFHIVPATAARAAQIADAQRARGLEPARGNLWRRASAAVALLAPLLVSVLVDAEDQARALEARGFGRPGRRTSLVTLPEQAWEPPARCAMLVGALLCFAALRGWFDLVAVLAGRHL